MEMPASPRADERRAETRASLYLAASLYCDGISTPAKIRNIAPGGALLDTATTVATGALVQLVRGSLIIHGLVSWSENCRCGIKFSGSIDVGLWRTRPESAEQQRIDDTIGLIKAGAVPLDQTDNDAEQVDSSSLAQDLARVVDLLGNCGSRLAENGMVVASYPSELQNLDIAMQLIDAVKATLDGTGDQSADPSRFLNLRNSVSKALGHTAT